MCFGTVRDETDGPPAKTRPAAAGGPAAAASVPASRKGRRAYRRQGDEGAAPPPGPPPQHQGNEYAAPPAGPPSQHQSNEYAAPPAGPPPQHRDNEYAAPPPGPPPQHQTWAAPPPDGAPPSQRPAPGHDWEAAVPDTSLFPPPPAIFAGHDTSPTNNATEAEAEAGEAWCAQHPLVLSVVLDAAATAALRTSNIRLVEPAMAAGFSGNLTWLGPGRWRAATDKNTPDGCIMGYPPLYVVNEHDPTRSGRPKTIYYEVKILAGSRHNTLALGFTALPYPSFRLPGWHRGSLAVHGDDGRKYINDRWGGKDFTHEFRRGETLGVGMTFGPARGGTHEVRVFFTRDGVLAGGWDLHEETDAEQDLPVTGLEGFHDLTCAVGVFGSVDFDVILGADRWKYRVDDGGRG